MRLSYRLPALLLVLLLGISTTRAQNGPSPEIRSLIDSLMGALNDANHEALGLFIAQRVHPDYVAEVGNEVLEEMLREARAAARGAGDLGVGRTQNGLEVMIRGGVQDVTVSMAIPFEAPNLITELGVNIDSGEIADAVDPGVPASLQEATSVRVQAVESLWSPGPGRQEHFLEHHVAPELRGPDLIATLDLIRTVGAAAGAIAVDPFEGGVLMELRGPRSLRIEINLGDASPFLITALQAEEIESERQAPPPAYTWDSLESQLEEAADNGFSGSVLAMRDGAMVVHRGFGVANGAGDPITRDTQFDIGSMPIDFTRAAVLLLVQRGQLDLDASISTYLPGVPSDKEGILVSHLVNGSSGLPNYHHVSTDDDADLTYIDRDEAVRRILSQQLLFAPGTGEAHSHSAWTLLAAMVELVSNTPYLDLLERHFFEPAEMASTGPYGPSEGFSASQQAEGFGWSQPANPNIPLNWGPTSWLVMGGGGMVSTPSDLYRWHNFVRRDGPLTAGSKAMLPSAGVFMGDSDRGFLTLAAFSDDSIIIASTNRFERSGDTAHQVMRGLAQLGR